MEYQSKYLKYKNKYLELKKLIGGSLEDCTKKRISSFNEEIYELIMNRRNAKRVLSYEQRQQNQTNNFKLFNINDEHLIFHKLISDPNVFNFMNNMNTTKLESTDDVSDKFAMIPYGDNLKHIPHIQSFCYGPTIGLIEFNGDTFINNWEKIKVGDIIRIWGCIDKEQKNTHIVIEITTSDNMSISFGIFFGEEVGLLSDETYNNSSRPKILEEIKNITDRSKAVIESPDSLFHYKLFQQFNKPENIYLKIVSQGILTEGEYKKLFELIKNINPYQDLVKVSLKESKYIFDKEIFSEEEKLLLSNDEIKKLYESPNSSKALVLHLLKEQNDNITLSKYNKYEELVKKQDKINLLLSTLKNRKNIIDRNNKEFFEKKINFKRDRDLTQFSSIVRTDNTEDVIYTYYLAYSWILNDVEYCMLTGFLPDLVSKLKKKKPTTNCTKLAQDLFSDKINCKRTSGIIDPQSCKSININPNCDKEDLPNDFIEFHKSSS